MFVQKLLDHRLGRIVTLLLACVTLAACGSGAGQGITSAKPSSTQLDAMSSYFLAHYAPQYGLTSHTGCVTYSMATHSKGDGRLIAYTQVICGSCPEAAGSEVTTPAVFHLRGASVTSALADTEPGDPTFENVITKIFPKSLQTTVSEQQIPKINALIQEADARGGC